MPQRNTIRQYLAGGYYHIYNRGVEKRIIFLDKPDYTYFLSLVESYLTPEEKFSQETLARSTPYWRSKLRKDEVEVLCYCLIPNHFHFILKQNTKDGITRFLRRISNSYVGYFNKKYSRQGTLFQGKFRAVLIDNDNYLLHLSRYIHLNCLEVGPLEKYPYSSYWEYLGRRKNIWVHTELILSFFRDSKKTKIDFKNLNTYKNFVESKILGNRNMPKELTLES